jgi:predicted HTH transcriptional regulator
MKSVRKKPTVLRKHSRTARGTVASKLKPHAPVAPPLVAPGTHWTFLTNHSHVLVLLSRNPSVVLREVALKVGITERAVQRIIADLEAGGIIEREKVGRQNHYLIRVNQPLRHAITSRQTIGELLGVINDAYH